MKIVDIDKIFEEFMTAYVKANAGKFTETEWEDEIAKLYADFGDKPLKELDGKTPNEFYADASGAELCVALSEHVKTGVPVSDYLVSALRASGDDDMLIGFINSKKNTELTAYAINILDGKGCLKPLEAYVGYVADPDTDENIRELIGEIVVNNAARLKEKILSVSKNAEAGEEYFFEALSSCPQDERIYSYLKECFLAAPAHLAGVYAGMLASYGDERAIDIITMRATEDGVIYADFKEYELAVEALGGTLDVAPDFSNDKSYRKIKQGK